MIIYPHFPPSNLAGVHRPRLFANHLKSFGWEPVVLTVHEKYYEEHLDWNLHKLLPADLRIEKVNAFPITKPRFIGDIGLRAFFQLRKCALDLLKTERFDFVYIPIPSFYVSLIGPYLHKKTGIKYGIDYIDPWVHQFPGTDKIFSRHWLSTKLAKWLEPLAVKKASIITGVAETYYAPVFERNIHLKNSCLSAAMQYGGEPMDHTSLTAIKNKPTIFSNNQKIKLIYAGAMLPKSYDILDSVFEAIQMNKGAFDNIEIYFVGTGKHPNDLNGHNVKPLAEKYSLWNSIIYEHPHRIPYLDVLAHLGEADGIFILGSKEAHYTPSKVFQSILSKTPVFAILHEESEAVKIIKKTNSGICMTVTGSDGSVEIQKRFMQAFAIWMTERNYFTNDLTITDFEENYSAKAMTKKLVALLDQTVNAQMGTV